MKESRCDAPARAAAAARALAVTLVLALLVAPPLGAATPGGAGQSGSAQLPAQQLEVKEAWIRWLPAGLPAGGYLTLANPSAEPLVLIGASSDAYRSVEMHASEHASGMNGMRPVEHITIPARGTLSFASAGYHLMLMQPTRALSPGEHVAITLHFAGGASRTVQFELRNPNGSSEAMPGMKDMGRMHGAHPPH